ncbi:MAG: TrmH family RNA methyltransferase [Bacteroidota bacterium]
MARTDRRSEKIRQVLAYRQPDLTVIIENVHDPHNVSAMFRSCDAVGVMQVELLYTVEKFPRIGKKSSSSANKWLDRRKHTAVAECYSLLRSEGFRVFASRLDPNAHSLFDLDLVSPVALVFGNEHRGVSDEAAALADGTFLIPMRGMIQSLNVSVACAVSLYEALRQRNAPGGNQRPKCDDHRRQILFDDWIKR